MTLIKPLSQALKEEMTHIRVENLQGRAVPLIALFDAEKWHVWLQRENNQVMHLSPVDAAEVMYFAKTAAREADDFQWAFIDFLVQRFALAKVANRVSAIIDDVWCLSASMAKLELIHTVDENRPALDWLVATEMEYVFSVCKSLFDLLQEVIVQVWSSIRMKGSDRDNPLLKQTFSEIVLRADKPLTAAEIAERSKIPAFLADYYASCGAFFDELRQLRVKFVHHGERFERIFVTERGFSVAKDAQPFARWNVWDEGSMETNIASLRPVIRYVITNTLSAFTGFAEVISRHIKFPPPLAPGYTIFFRNAYNGALLRALDPEAKWWDYREEKPPVTTVTAPPLTSPAAPEGVATPDEVPKKDDEVQPTES